MINDYDFLCGNDFTFVKIALGNDDYHTIKVQAELAKTIDFSGGIRNLEKIIINECNNLTQIKWPEHAQSIKHLTIGNSANLDNLDLLGLVNLEELSIVNCEKLTKIKGLGRQIKRINTQGCKLDSLDLSQCNKLEDFILTTHESNLNLNFKHSAYLHSVVINVEPANHQKIENFYQDSTGHVNCTFNECTHLNTLAINSPHTSTTIDITGCSNLRTAMFLLDEEAQIIGVATCSQLDKALDLENKMIAVNQHTIEKKKNALKMPENTADMETIIEQNGFFKNKKSCLVNLQLLMSPRKNSSIPIHNKYLINHCKISPVDAISFHSKFEYQNESVVLKQESKWRYETVSNPIVQDLQFPSTFISQQSLWSNYLSNNQENKYKKIDKLQLYAPQIQRKYVNNSHLFLAKGHFMALGYPLKNYKPNQTPLTAKAGLIYNPAYLPVIGPKKVKPMPTFFIKEVTLKTDEQEKKTGKKEKSNSSDLFIVGPLQSDQVPLTATPALTPAGNENNNVLSLELENKQIPKLNGLSAPPEPAGYESRKTNVSAYDVNKTLVSENDLVGTKKETVTASPLTTEPVLTDYETETSHLSVLDIKIKSNSQNTLSPAEKTKITTLPITLSPVCANYETKLTFLSDLDIKVRANSQNALASAEKIKAEPQYLTSDAVLTKYEIDSAYLNALDIKEKTDIEGELIEAKKVKATGEHLTVNATDDTNEPKVRANENSDFTFTVARALVDLKPRNSDLFNNDFQSPYFTEINEQINKSIKEIQDNLNAQNNLISVEKVQARNQYISADPILAPYETDETSLTAINIRLDITSEDNLIATQTENAEHFSESLLELTEGVPEEVIHDYQVGVEFDALRELLIECDLLDDVLNDETGTLLQYMIEKTKSLEAHQDDFDNLHEEVIYQHNVMDTELEVFSEEDEDYESTLLVNSGVGDATEFDALRELLIECDLLDDVLNDETGTLLQYMIEKTKCLEGHQDDFDNLDDVIYQHNVMDTELEVFSQEDEDYESTLLDTCRVGDAAEFDALRELLIECDLLDDVLNDETGTLLQYMIEKTKCLEGHQDDFDNLDDDIYQGNSLDTELEISGEEYGDVDAMDCDVFDPLDSALQTSDPDMSDEMNELLNIMTDEEMELLFPQGKNISTNKAYFEALQSIANKPELEINLKNIAPEHMKQLLHFFDSQEQSGIYAWDKGVTYAFADGTQFTFKNDVFQRARKAGHEGTRYETISNKKQLGEGGFGKVRRIKGTVSLDTAAEVIHFKKHGAGGKKRVVKVQQHSEDTNPLSHYQEGFNFAKRAVHLAIKEPTVISNSKSSQTSYTVMNEIAGRELFDIRADDYEGIDVLSTQERIDLTKALLLALKEQVTDQDLVHRDIKPENIMVDLGPPIGVKIIDYDMSMELPDGKFVGTEGYYAPELVSAPMRTSAKSDVYSMARVIALIWRVDLATYIENEDFPYTPDCFIPEDTLFGIFNGIDDLSEEEKIGIERTLTGMLAPDPDQRFSIDEAIQSFDLPGIEKEWNIDEILDWLAEVDTCSLPTTELSATLDLINASNFSRDSSLLYNKAQITPLLELITEQSDTQIVRQTIRALFIIPFKWIAENEIKFDPSKPAMFFQMDAEEQAEVFKELMKNSEVRHILFEELFFPENRLILEMFHENELVTNELFMEKNRSGYSSVFFQPKGDEGEDHHGINHILFVDPEAIKVC